MINTVCAQITEVCRYASIYMEERVGVERQKGMEGGEREMERLYNRK